MTDNLVKLKPCPFCGSEANVVTWPAGRRLKVGWEYWRARPYCAGENCVAEMRPFCAGTQHHAKEFATKAWNTRPKRRAEK